MDLNNSISLVIESYNAELKEKNIAVEVNLDSTIPLIYADRSQMEQIFLNIIKNSKEAVPVNGHLKITTQKNPVLVIFEDDGTGLSKEVSEKLFTPFISTKSGGQGIGLTLIQEILTNHGFAFSFRNKENGGTEFMIICSNHK